MIGYLTHRVALHDVRSEKPSTIYYSTKTCWWTHKASDLYCSSYGLPCDPRSGMLLQTDDVEGFLRAAEEHSSSYGRHGLRAFEAAHHGNVVVSAQDPRPTCFTTWEEYNQLLDNEVVK